MPYSLPGRNVLVIGGARGLGAVVAQKFAAEGSNVAINYLSSKDIAEKVAADLANTYNVKTITVQGDASKKDEATKAVTTTIEQLGGLDVVISNAGWTKITNFADLDAMDDDDWDKCWNVNVKSSFYLFKAAAPTLNANPDGGAFIITASTAGVVPSGSSLPYSVAKAALIHLMKCLAQTQGAKIRTNAVLPGLMLTEWGQGFPEEKVEAMREKMVLKKVPEVEDVAELYVNIARNSSMTGQSIQIDSGFAIR